MKRKNKEIDTEDKVEIELFKHSIVPDSVDLMLVKSINTEHGIRLDLAYELLKFNPIILRNPIYTDILIYALSHEFIIEYYVASSGFEIIYPKNNMKFFIMITDNISDLISNDFKSIIDNMMKDDDEIEIIKSIKENSVSFEASLYTKLTALIYKNIDVVNKYPWAFVTDENRYLFPKIISTISFDMIDCLIEFSNKQLDLNIIYDYMVENTDGSPYDLYFFIANLLNHDYIIGSDTFRDNCPGIMLPQYSDNACISSQMKKMYDVKYIAGNFRIVPKILDNEENFYEV